MLIYFIPTFISPRFPPISSPTPASLSTQFMCIDCAFLQECKAAEKKADIDWLINKIADHQRLILKRQAKEKMPQNF